MPSGHLVTVSDVAMVYPSTGPSMINRENLQRRIVISANTSGGDLHRVVTDIQKRLDSIVLPNGYYLSLEGQFKSQQEATRMIVILGTLSLVGIVALLYLQFRSWVLVVQIMLTIPLAVVGSVVAVFLTERQFSVATLIAFITLCGIASRNGIMMISHYLHLIRYEGEVFSKDLVLRGAQERLVPVLMTALTAGLALVPLLMAKGEPGKKFYIRLPLSSLGDYCLRRFWTSL